LDELGQRFPKAKMSKKEHIFLPNNTPGAFNSVARRRKWPHDLPFPTVWTVPIHNDEVTVTEAALAISDFLSFQISLSSNRNFRSACYIL